MNTSTFVKMGTNDQYLSNPSVTCPNCGQRTAPAAYCSACGVALTAGARYEMPVNSQDIQCSRVWSETGIIDRGMMFVGAPRPQFQQPQVLGYEKQVTPYIPVHPVTKSEYTALAQCHQPQVSTPVINVQTTQVVAPAPPQERPRQPKSVGAAFLLTFLFGPLGLFYATTGGAVLLLMCALLFSITLPFLEPIIWISSMIWAISAASNRRG